MGDLNQPAFDPDEALSIVDGDKALFLELASTFRDSYSRELGAIREAIRSGDAEGLLRASNHFKGTLGALAAGPARETVELLEELGRRGDLSRAERAYERIEQQVRALQAALSDWS